MNGTKKKSNRSSVKTSDGGGRVSQSTALTRQSETSVSPVKPPNLSTSVAKHLLNLMQEVTRSDVNASTVLAACQCAKEIREIIKLNRTL